MPDRTHTRPASAPAGAVRVLAYLRVSTKDQHDNGHGLDAQRAAITRYCDFRNLEIAGWIEDSASGKSLARAGVQEALSRLKAGEVDGLVVHKLDRLTRSLRDFGELVHRFHARGWQLHVLDPELDLASPFGRAMAGIIAVFGELEREQISDRTKQGLAAARAKGVRLGAARQVSDEAEATIRLLFERGLGRDGIALELDRLGVPSPNGGRWSAETVRRSLNRQGLRRPRGRVTRREREHA